MKRKSISVLLLLLLFPFRYAAQETKTVVLDNGLIRREICYTGTKLYGKSYRFVENNTEYIQPESMDFSVNIDDVTCNGFSDWTHIIHRDTSDSDGGKGFIVSLNTSGNRAISIELIYMTYPGVPVVRKALRVKNNGQKDIKIDRVDVECLQLQWSVIDSWILTHYARHKWYGPFLGDWNDPLVVVHDLCNRKGIAVGNEANGVVKRTSAFLDGKSITAGLTHPDQAYGFRKWLRSGEQWTSPWVFTVLYDHCADPSVVINTTVPSFTKKHMGVQVEKLKEKPIFAYNTWYPFCHNINEQLVKELAKAAADCGVEEFIIDDGWQLNTDTYEGKGQLYGDWEVDKNKFPNGLKPVFDYIKSLGMKPGLWVTLATADPSGKVYKEHPEYFVKDMDGKPANLHAETGLSRTACMATDWYDYIKQVILRLVGEHGLAYLKLDLAVVTSAYVFDNGRTGCYATDHPHHRDREESYAVIYDRCMQLFDELHRDVPELFIDCTFETEGKLHLVDYGVVKHAEGDWLSNIQQAGVSGLLRMRGLAWERCPVIPATSLLIGNLSMNDPEHELGFKSLTGTLPIMLGDPRKLTPEERNRFKSWTKWLKRLENTHHVMSFRQDLPGFGEPAEGSWDGFCRINTETGSGGFIGVFRQGSKEKSRLITIPWLNQDKEYVVKKGYEGTEIITLTGKQLRQEGFMVHIEKEYDGDLYEITEITIKYSSNNANNANKQSNIPSPFPGRYERHSRNEPAKSRIPVGRRKRDITNTESR
jgi:alpha-galactosidase